ncbi:MAG: hypothetical protein JSR17_08385 [Proteobacteria bacterium]|nr:hypothetical protein [Pseudomonadota bacterium]
MATLNIQLTDDFNSELTNIAEQLKVSPEQCVQLALHHFFQTDTVENAIEAIARIDDGQALVDFPELKEELGIDIKFHPDAMDELESVSEEDQIDILERLINRISANEDELEATLDIVLKEQGENQLVLSGFSFGDIVYELGENVVIYHIALIEDSEEDEDEGDDEEEDEDDDEADLEDEDEDEEAEEDSLEKHEKHNH